MILQSTNQVVLSYRGIGIERLNNENAELVLPEVALLHLHLNYQKGGPPWGGKC